MNYTATAARPVAVSFAPAPTTWLRLAVLYLMAGVALGIAMGATENFTLRPVHAHLNLLGWTTLALAGLVYSVYPKAAASRLARIHFWLHNVSLPVMMGSLAALLLGRVEVLPALVMSEFVAAGGVMVFACNIFLNVTPLPAQRESAAGAAPARA
jgi:hypothetical protein